MTAIALETRNYLSIEPSNSLYPLTLTDLLKEKRGLYFNGDPI